MKDIHNHILFGIDDGSESLEESIQIIKKAVQNGYTDLILTPHYRTIQGYVCDNLEKKKRFDLLQEELKEQNIDVRLYLGNEITVDSNLMEYFDRNQVLPLNHSRYILLELPFQSRFSKLHDLIFKLRSLGCVPIIAHPERYEYYSDFNEFQRMIKEGALLQGNIGSLYGKYGKNVQVRLEEMLKRRMIHFIGSDVHHAKQTSYQRISDVETKIAELTGSREIARDLVDGNIDKVIRNKIVQAYAIRVPKRRLRIRLGNR